MAEDLKQVYTTIPQAVFAWKKLKTIYITRQMYLIPLQDEYYWEPEMRFANFAGDLTHDLSSPNGYFMEENGFNVPRA